MIWNRLESVNAPLRRSPPETVSPPDDVVRTVRFDVLAHPVHAHFGMHDGERIEEASDLAIDVVHLRIALLDVHQHAVPLKIASRRIVLVVLKPVRLAARRA